MGLSYGRNWTGSASVSSQAVSSSYSGFGPNMGNFNPSGNPPAGGINSFFQPTPMGITPNPQMLGGNNVPLQQPSLGSGYTPNMPNPNILSIGNLYQMGGYQTMPQAYPGSYPYNLNQYMGGAYGLVNNTFMPPFNQTLFVNTPLPFLATLELPNLSKLTNHPILHHPAWPLVPIKIPTNIPKFEGKTRYDPTSRISTYHLWCVSNSMFYDLVKLRLFPRTLIGNATKWFIELPTSSFHDFGSLAMAFLIHFQLPIRYETGTDLLTSLR